MTERLLVGRCKLHDVQDVEAFCGRLLDDHLRRTRAHLNPVDRADCLTHLIGAVWELSRKWDPSHGLSFSSYSWRLGKFKVVDWYRIRYGRNRYGGDVQRNINMPLSLDGPADGNPDATSLGDAVAGGSGDPQADSPADLSGLLGGGDCITAQDTKIIRRLAA